MNLEKIAGKELIITSHDQGKAFNKSYSFAGFQFRLVDLNYLDKLDDELKAKLITQIPRIKRTSLGGYHSYEGLDLFFKKSNNKILIVSAGETQREQYKLFVEGIWLFSNQSILNR